MNFNFELILFYAVAISGVIALIDILFLAKKRKLKYAAATKGQTSPPPLKMPIIIDYARSFFPILLLVFLLRAFLFEPFRIPTGSLEPTLSVGDFIIVNKYHYGLRLPVIHSKILSLEEPKRGDIFVFRWPPNPSVNFIKRVIGLPGDKISYVDKILYINGVEASQLGIEGQTPAKKRIEKKENLLGVTHAIYENPNKISEDFHDLIVPPGMYFAMGDNRDDSADSRVWGFVPEENIVGKANYVWLSWDSDANTIRWKRFGTEIK